MGEGFRTVSPSSLDRLQWDDEISAPPPASGEIRVALKASSLNFHDYLVVTGNIPAANGRIPMSDGAGHVIDVGPDVTGFAPGDSVVSLFFPNWHDGRLELSAARRVPGDGIDGYARTIVTSPAGAFTRSPVGYSHEEAATLPCAAVTAWRSLRDGGLKPGDTVLVQGTGGVSIFALQFAKASGAVVVATSSSDAKLEQLRALGATHVINYRTDASWGETARRLTGGVDHVVEIGGAGTLDQSVAACRNGGNIALVGVLAGRAAPVATAALMAKQIQLRGLTVGSRRHQIDMIRAIEAAGIRPVIDSRFALSDLAAAFRHQASGAHFGKIVIEIDRGG